MSKTCANPAKGSRSINAEESTQENQHRELGAVWVALGGAELYSWVVKVLFIGGTGFISTSVSRVAVARGLDLYHLN